MKKILIAAGIIMALGACSSKPKEEVVEVPEVPVVQPVEPHWARADATAEDAQQQLSRCRYDVGMNAANLENSRVNALIEDCMRKEGYQWVTQ